MMFRVIFAILVVFLGAFGLVHGFAQAKDIAPPIPSVKPAINQSDAYDPSAIDAEKYRAAPEMATGKKGLSVAKGKDFMAVTAHPDATRAAYSVLSNGGTAADAGIAAQLVLGLVEPQSSGIGGGAFALYYNAQNKHLFSIDGRETAPSNAGPYLFTKENGKTMKFYEAGNGGRAVGVPGTLRLLEKLHNWEGKTPWYDLAQPAIKLARDGFTVTSRLNKMLEKEGSRFNVDTEAKLYFYPDTVTPIHAGATKSNLKYADTLQKIAETGAGYFYSQSVAKNIVEKVQKNRKNPGLLSLEDFQDYTVIERAPVCGDYRKYKICSMGQPSSGGLTLLMILGMVEKYDLAKWGPKSAKSWHVISEASRLAFADRNLYMADPDFVKTPNTRLLDKGYLNARGDLISLKSPLKAVSAGIPPDWPPQGSDTPDDLLKPPGTSHISIIDSYGNILSMTSSIQNAFGSRVMVDGFLLNNELTDFAFDPNGDNGLMKANAAQAGKRPRSSMSPTIIFDPKGRPFMVVGSAGGSRIIGYVLQRIIAAIDWDMDLKKSMKMPHIVHRGKKLELESSGVEMAEKLKDFGHPVMVGEMNSGLTALQFKGKTITGAADPRRDGVAMGE